MIENHGWRGPGNAKVARVDNTLIVCLPGVSTRAGRMRKALGDLFRKSYKIQRGTYDFYDVTILVRLHNIHRKIDLDNIAKTTLDALKGYIFKDDSQITSLQILKESGTKDKVYIFSTPAPPDKGEQRIHYDLLARAEKLQ